MRGPLAWKAPSPLRRARHRNAPSMGNTTSAAQKLCSTALQRPEANFPEPPDASSIELTSGSQGKAQGPHGHPPVSLCNPGPAPYTNAPASLTPNLPRRKPP